jgi:outer membrane lipoprotein SlyB
MFGKIKKVLTLCALSMVILGCSANSGAKSRPIVDSKGVDMNRYQADLSDCQSYAQQTSGAGASAVAGAVAGAAIGAAFAALAGDGYSKSANARVGALSGGLSAASKGMESQQSIINKCLTGRGYSVLK